MKRIYLRGDFLNGGTSNSKLLTFLSKVKSTLSLKAIIPLFLVLFMFGQDAIASHGRGGNISWQKTATLNQVQITTKLMYRTSFGYGVTIAPGVNIVVGTLDFGDGTYESVNLTVTSVNASEDWFAGEFVTTHTYAATGNYSASFTYCCRLSNLEAGNADADFRSVANITIGNANDGPVSAMPPYLVFPPSVTSTYQMPGTDPNGDGLTFSLAPNSETYLVSNSAVTISPTGLLTFDGTGKVANQLYAVAIKITDSKGASTTMDFMIKVSTATSTNNTPAFNYPPTPANATIYNILPGQNVNFAVSASDADASDVVNLSAVGVPSGASFTTVNGNPGTGSFNWTPTAGQTGSYVLSFAASDGAAQVNSFVTINVSSTPVIPGSGDFETRWTADAAGTITIPANGAGYNYNVMWENLTTPGAPV
ncbi:MAG TPA: putative Ig domain-containing protein, partial [Edaphocola sp.]|nr:putative Ig domain-containing protein [Edaphocola sp.]